MTTSEHGSGAYEIGLGGALIWIAAEAATTLGGCPGLGTTLTNLSTGVGTGLIANGLSSNLTSEQDCDLTLCGQIENIHIQNLHIYPLQHDVCSLMNKFQK